MRRKKEHAMIAILGATGKTGSVAARRLLGQGHAVRVVGRSRERLGPLVQAGAQAVVADLEDGLSVERALQGATAAYVLIPPNFAVAEFRAYQRRVSDAITGALRRARVPRAVLLSSLGADHPVGTGPVVALHEIEQHLRAVPDLHVVSLRAGFFMENFLMQVSTIRRYGVLTMPLPAELPLSVIAAPDIGRYAAERLGQLESVRFEAVNLVGPRPVTPREITQTLGTAIGRPDLPYVETTYQEAEDGLCAAGLAPELAALYVELYRGAAGGLLAPEVGTGVVATETDITEFARDFAVAFRAALAA
jgi:uncharacterized protein YbjT (DUF2867 family)